ncbi:phospholipase A2 inhibitor and Ly6/PLAUR domain-containing protein-like [Podarcis raffonei]|uniref:phospholipase A2 inhibitor and Ly6/PLAUR domain-containing protein-like n=1 Tax=Podarcis raffonei TaxID=65483 RepID=UPI0023291009|nr:phospholipase A2 inhibitor and Ly6/PLAUR domain-containing protein-like [Podarcis raffonei]
MMKTLLISCLLLTLLNPVASLTCESCFNQGKDCKNATIEECDESSDQSCMSALGVGKLSLLGSNMVLKSCIDTELCDADYASASITSSMYIHSKISCCKTDMCNSGPPEMPASETRELNGLKCPSCLTILTDECEGNKTVSCRNEEDQCFYAGGLVKFGETTLVGALRGCATASMCDYGQEMLVTYLKSLGYEITQLECTDAMDEDANEL